MARPKGSKNPKGGRKSGYKEEYCKQIIDYFMQKEPFEVIEVTAFGNTYKKRWANPMPTFEKFATKLKVTTETLENWGKKDPNFFEAYNICKAIQKTFLFENGTLGLYNSDFSKFFGKNCLGLKDKQETGFTDKDGNDVKLTFNISGLDIEKI